MAHGIRAEGHFLPRRCARQHPPMTTDPGSAFAPSDGIGVSRRGFLRGALLAGGGVVATSVVAACTPALAPSWTAVPIGAPPTSGPGPTPTEVPTTAPDSSHDHASPGASPGADDHDASAAATVKRFLDGEAASVEGPGNQPYGEPKRDGDWKVFELTVDSIKHKVDAIKD